MFKTKSLRKKLTFAALSGSLLFILGFAVFSPIRNYFLLTTIDDIEKNNLSRITISAEEQALKDAIESGQVASAALDVCEAEPDIQASVLTKVDGNIVLTPHLGASTKEAQLNVAIDVANQIRDVLTGGSAKSAVNIPSLKPSKLEPVKDYMKLAENIGGLAMQIADGNLKSIEIIAKSLNLSEEKVKEIINSKVPVNA